MADTIQPTTAWQPFEPSTKNPWDAKKVGHLYRRAAFGATVEELEEGIQLGVEKAVDRLLTGGKEQEAFDKAVNNQVTSITRTNDGNLMRAWWLYRMLYGNQPLREKMTLFWHNHFATSNAKVLNAGFMLGQYRLLYTHALGKFRPLLQEISKDPAMLVWLDGRDSKKGNPNENYARELMELFSLGIGNYTEKDIREAARAFTGWEIHDGKAVFTAAQHDTGEKQVFGKKGKFQGNHIVDLCLEQKSCPFFIVGKLFRFLVGETVPAKELLEPLAEQFRKSDYDFGSLVRTVLRSNYFYSAECYRSRIKSPVDFALGIIRPFRAMEKADPDGKKGRIGTTALAVSLEELGQNVFYPPSVKGWDGGETWLNSQTLLSRHNLSLALTSTVDGRFGDRLDPADLVRNYKKKSDEEIVDFFVQIYLQGDISAEARDKLLGYLKGAQTDKMPDYFSKEEKQNHRIRALCRLVLTLPEFQLS